MERKPSATFVKFSIFAVIPLSGILLAFQGYILTDNTNKVLVSLIILIALSIYIGISAAVRIRKHIDIFNTLINRELPSPTGSLLNTFFRLFAFLCFAVIYSSAFDTYYSRMELDYSLWFRIAFYLVSFLFLICLSSASYGMAKIVYLGIFDEEIKQYLKDRVTDEKRIDADKVE